MKAKEALLLPFLSKPAQFKIPIFQRNYSWKKKQCKQLLEDIINAGSKADVESYFIGSVVIIVGEDYTHANIPLLMVIDGQQRLTTISLLIAALCQTLGDRVIEDDTNVDKLRNYFLVNPQEVGELNNKLVLNGEDRLHLNAIVSGVDPGADSGNLVDQNFRFFKEELKDEKTQDIVNKGLRKLAVVSIDLDRKQDNPQLIFESLNSTGLDLSQSDLIRNYVLMGLGEPEQTDLYQNHWLPMESAFGLQDSGAFDSFMRDYLTIFAKAGVPEIKKVYEAFKRYAQNSEEPVKKIAPRIQEYSEWYVPFALEKETDSELLAGFKRINGLKAQTTYPFLLDLYSEYKRDRLSKSDFVECLQVIECYIFRRAICDLPSHTHRVLFATLSANLDRDAHLNCLKAKLLLLRGNQRFPEDSEFVEKFKSRDLYVMRSRNWIYRLENFSHPKEPVKPGDGYSIEHILPQNENLSQEWREALGPHWEEIQATKVHTLGNLTLTGYNSELSDRPFYEKREMDGGFKNSPLRLNEGLGQIDSWDVNSIDERAGRLSEIGLKVWARPQVIKEVLNKYRPPKVETTYTIEKDHTSLLSEPNQTLFSAIREHVLGLDEQVSETVQKKYVVFKLERGFVWVIPQKKSLTLVLNMSFEAVTDPDGKCEDISSIRHLGNGDVRIRVKGVDDLSFTFDLLEQTYEAQFEVYS